MKNTYKKLNLAKIHNKISRCRPHSAHSSQIVMHHRAYDNATPTKQLSRRRSIKPNRLFVKYRLKSLPPPPPLISRDITIFASKYMLRVVRHHYRASTQTSPYNKAQWSYCYILLENTVTSHREPTILRPLL
ncbi:hypothetical protein L484_013385 [Morus notabilis]|uniref:Uncharacterized protein n=1 Tax=Morus notabilis TaxID=981085 RepID=W9QZ93_9ROSA|nr:hypothetical protein L484_013385 [Morus notabilis]